MTTTIRVTIKTVSHPEPERLVDVWSQIVLKELRAQEEAAKEEVTT